MNLRNKARNYILTEIKNIKNFGAEKLPPERELAKKYNISRVTLRSALADLEREGKIIRKQGKGTFISPNFEDMKVDLFRMKTYSQIIQEQGYDISVNTLETKLVKTPQFVKTTGLYDFDSMVLTSRIYYANKIVAAICIDFLEIFFKRDLHKISLYPGSIFKYLYDNYAIELSAGSIQFHAINSEDITKYIKIAPHLLSTNYLLIRGIEYDLMENPRIFTREYVNTDIIPITAIRRR
ncbi:GntR family transcriptional regulator [Peptoniphilus olsenii]|uniref:GntR family transcriptional regulator n=1 Tax=Peptoniphilus olsenii TaxID=411570 RepID=A0ABV2J8U1_9FIRM